MQDQRPRLRAGLDAIGTVAVIAACCVFIWAVLSARSAKPEAGGASEKGSRSRGGPVLPAEPLSLTGAVLGQETAPLAVMMFSDFECPFCGKFARETMPTVIANWVNTGKARVFFRHLPLESVHQIAFEAAEIAECARRQSRFWSVHDFLFASPSKLTVSHVREAARVSGLRETEFDSCVQGEADSAVRADMEEASRLGVTGTPTFFFGTVDGPSKMKVRRRQSGALPPQAFERILSDLLKAPPK